MGWRKDRRKKDQRALNPPMKIILMEWHPDGAATIVADNDCERLCFTTRPGYRAKYKGTDDETGHYVKHANGEEDWTP